MKKIDYFLYTILNIKNDYYIEKQLQKQKPTC